MLKGLIVNIRRNMFWKCKNRVERCKNVGLEQINIVEILQSGKNP